MPFYEYRCTACQHQDSFLESINAAQKKTCPQCGKRQAFHRLISAAGFQLKGDGWYVTDFKNKKTDDKKKTAKSDGDSKKKDSKETKETKETKSSDTKKSTAD